MQNVAVAKNGFDTVIADVVGDHIHKGSGSNWLRGSNPADMEASYAVIMTSMRMGESRWESSKLKEIVAELVIVAGVPGDVRHGYGPYSSVLRVDQDGLVCTYTSHSWTCSLS
jgi:hypothetical protein